MSHCSRTQNSIFYLLLCSGTLCFGLMFSLFFLFCALILPFLSGILSSKNPHLSIKNSNGSQNAKNQPPKKSSKVMESSGTSENHASPVHGSLPSPFLSFPSLIPSRFSQPILTLLCAGYLPFLAFWGNIPRFTGCPQLTNEEAFWIFNGYTLLIEFFLLYSEKSDSVRSFLLLIALEQIISGLTFHPDAFAVILFLPSLFFLLKAFHSAACASALKQSFQLEMQNTCEEMIQSFSSYSRAKRNPVPSSSSTRRSASFLRKTPVTLGNAGETEIREHLLHYPIRLERKKHSLRFISFLDSVEKIQVWEESSSPFSVPPSFLRLIFWLIASLIFGLLFFLTVYRPEHFTSGNFGWMLPSSIGYSENSRLGEIGPQLGNPKPFFWLRLFADDGTQKWQIPLSPKNFAPDALVSDFIPFEPNGPLYLRGAVFDRYEDAGWRSSPTMFGVNPTARTSNTSRSEFLHFRNTISKTPGLIRTEETFEPTLESTFFTFWPSLLPGDDFDFPSRFSTRLEKIQFSENEPTAGVPYSLLSQGFFLRRLTECSPFPTAECFSESMSENSFKRATKNSSENVSPLPMPSPAASTILFAQSPWSPALFAFKNPEYSRKPDENRFPSLCRQAEEWSSENQTPSTEYSNADPSTLKTALQLARQLSFSPRFHYSTSPIRRERNLDPLEDFIRNHPQGHCEFYAASLVLMLRSRGIPARYAVGFAAQEYSPAARAWIVRHQDAHAWAEAWIPPHEIPEDVKKNSPVPLEHWHHGAWLRLDPTSRQVAKNRMNSHGPLFSVTSAWETLWKNYFLNLNFKNQQSLVYEPFTNFIHSAVTNTKKFAKYFPDKILLTASLLFVLSVAIRRFIPRLFQAKNTMPKPDSSLKKSDSLHQSTARDSLAQLKSIQKRREHSIQFFLQLEKDLLAKGMKRANGETSLEFMDQAEKKLGRSDLKTITRKYYLLRFGAKEKQDE
ncbi:MAG: transglutaminase domain-containing protein [Planctomycetaceae bacterium]|nr:transglutaminase domain-containing protein [Planctomycetaceae bacterium]